MTAKVKGAPKGGPGAAAAKKARDARNRARRAKARKQAKKKKDCNKKVSKKKQKRLRKASPSTAATNKVNKDARKPLKCPLCGRGSPFAAAPPSTETYAKLSADHIVPFKEIIKKPGFACLSEENQKKVINNPSNFAGVCPPCNSSRQETKWDKWKGHDTFGMTNSGKKFAAGMAAKAPGLSSKLSAQIGSLL
jgi:hypothetical protein